MEILAFICLNTSLIDLSMPLLLLALVGSPLSLVFFSNVDGTKVRNLLMLGKLCPLPFASLGHLFDVSH